MPCLFYGIGNKIRLLGETVCKGGRDVFLYLAVEVLLGLGCCQSSCFDTEDCSLVRWEDY